MNKQNTNLKPAIILAGYAASGKTTLAKRLAADLGFAFVDIGSIVRKVAQMADNRGIDLADEGELQKFLVESEIRFEVNEDVKPPEVFLYVNHDIVSAEDDSLRAFYLDTVTLPLNALMDDQLSRFQREVAERVPVVFSVRNHHAFESDEAVRFFIDPGTDVRCDRRSRWEFGKAYGDLGVFERLTLNSRVVQKELTSMDLGVSLYPYQVDEEGFIRFDNSQGTIADAQAELLKIAEGELIRRGILQELFHVRHVEAN